MYCGNLSATKLQVKKSRAVYFLSTKHTPSMLNDSGKLLVNDDYNHFKVGVDQLDEIISNYSYKPILRRWNVCLFLWLINVCAQNSSVIYKKRNIDILE